MSTRYFGPVPDPDGIHLLAGGWVRFTDVICYSRGKSPERQCATEIGHAALDRLTAPRSPVAGLSLDQPRIMGILNATPDSFSDGGLFDDAEAGFAHARDMLEQGADILDIGGESTRPGAQEVPPDQEVARTVPLIARLRAEGFTTPLSIDTRKAAVARAALDAGADLINDVSAFSHDPEMSRLAVETGAPACLMHAQGNPDTMQIAPKYQNAVLDVYDYLENKLSSMEAQGMPRNRVLVDVGIGFGKTVSHNLELLRALGVFHGLGCGILLGASRKSFIGALTGAQVAAERLPGSLAVALHGVAQGVQVLRVHDVEETRQALTVWGHLTRREGP
ncbi:dihydropteroate synthase [Tropicimonas sp. S265A]|uniref:dihydropteroate synthase n=1 Tax=Tropicimonas sp. S265A TaxID=3415134 RepID=UPI003C79D4A4